MDDAADNGHVKEDRDVVLLKKIGYAIVKPLEWLVNRFSLVGEGTFFDTGLFPWIADVESNFDAIEREMRDVLARRDDVIKLQELSRTEKILAWDNKWRTFVFYMFGHKSEQNCEFCPETAKTLSRIPGMTAAFFSILDPGKHIPAHRGIYNGVLRYHLALRIPKPAESCRFRVGDDVVHWQEGKSLIFDDANDHEVWVDAGEQKVLLIIDVLRPIRRPMSLLNRAVVSVIRHSPQLLEVKRNMAKADQHFHAPAAVKEQESIGVGE
jgi:beta-hydroxylase